MREMKYGLAALLALAGSAATADKLSDFKEARRQAADKKGCLSIPYRDTQSTCITQQAAMHEWCDGKKGPVTCGNESVTPRLLQTLVTHYKAMEALKERRKGLDDKRSRTSVDSEKSQLGKDIEQVDKDIYDLDKTIDQAKRDIETRKKFVEEGVYTIDKCIDYRRAVMNNFAAAIDASRSESEDVIKDDARELREYWESTKRNHEIQIDNTKEALANCKKALP